MTPQPPAATIRQRVDVPLRFGDGYTVIARLHTFRGLVDGREHLALGFVARWRHTTALHSTDHEPLVRLHSECLTGDVFGSGRCDCGAQLREAVGRIAEVGGYVLYLRQEGRGIGLYGKVDAYALQDEGLDTYAANEALGYPKDARDYTAAAQMLHALGAPRIVLLSNNPDKARQLAARGVVVARRVPTAVHVSPTNVTYLQTKAARGGHDLTLPVEEARHPAYARKH